METRKPIEPRPHIVDTVLKKLMEHPHIKEIIAEREHRIRYERRSLDRREKKRVTPLLSAAVRNVFLKGLSGKEEERRGGETRKEGKWGREEGSLWERRMPDLPELKVGLELKKVAVRAHYDKVYDALRKHYRLPTKKEFNKTANEETIRILYDFNRWVRIASDIPRMRENLRKTLLEVYGEGKNLVRERTYQNSYGVVRLWKPVNQ